MASIFRKDDNFVDKPNRNSFDLSFQNNLTTKFGVLKPVYCQEVLPGDSMKIRPDFALRFLPMVFPVQTRMRAHLHFFYVRNRTIWKDWMDFIGKTKDGLVPPYINVTNSNRSMFDVGGIADMFGVPVVLNSSVPMFLGAWTEDSKYYYDFARGKFTDELLGFENVYSSGTANGTVTRLADLRYSEGETNIDNVYVWPVEYGNIPSDAQEYEVGLVGGYNDSYAYFVFECEDGNYYTSYYNIVASMSNKFSIDLSSFPSTPIKFVGALYSVEEQQSAGDLSYTVIPSASPDGIALESLPLSTLQRFFGVNNGETISALPFRAYEAIYNSFYRNAENNPYILNGVPEYNKYIPTYDGGADSNNYSYHNRNWEDDFLTTAVQTPQQGNAPLVGLVNNGNAPYIVTFANDDGTTSRVKFGYSSGNNVVRVEDNSQISSGYVGQLEEAMIEAVKFGISINDFRNVNSFQRWLENNVRKGYKYRDQIKGHYGVSVRYDELDMPEFIGGVSRDVSVQQITQTVKNEFGELGEFGGNSYVMGSGETINHYCDEHGFIIGILSVVPMANYSQVIPKYLIKHDALDYYFPEFGKIGMQPIQNKEVTFLESIDEGKKDEIFGYQRAWYDYLARTDEVHGLFRTNLRNFLVGRTFNSLPSLSAQFSTIDNEQLNNIFYVDDDEDKILGQIYFDVTGVRPIPIYGIPSIE